jgi:hypothetical protein
MSRDDERRRYKRETVSVPTRVSSRSVSSDIGMTLDLSLSGARLTTRTPFRVGERVDVTFRTPILGARRFTSFSGRVVRQSASEDESLWPHEIAVRFDSTAFLLKLIIDYLNREHAA